MAKAGRSFHAPFTRALTGIISLAHSLLKAILCRPLGTVPRLQLPHPLSLPAELDAERASNSTPQRQLPPAVQLHILSFLPPNDRAINGRLTCKDAADGLSGPQHCTAFLSQPLPPHATPGALEAGQQHARTLSFRHKLLLLSTATASGSEVNLEVALAMLRPSIFPKLLQQQPSSWPMAFICPDPGVAAVKAGHLHLLSWLVRHCPALLRPERVLEAAARHCDLAGLQAAWEVMRNVSSSSSGSSSGPVLGQLVLNAAVESSTPDVLAKMEWVLASGRPGSCRLAAGTTAEAAVQSGNLGRLRWLRNRDCLLTGEGVLLCALRHADLDVVQWLVDEGGCPLLPRDPRRAVLLHEAAAKSPDGAAKMQWLQERGAPALEGNGRLLRRAMLGAVEAGQVEVVRYLLTVQGAREALQGDARCIGQAAAERGSVPMAEFLRQAGLVFDHTAYGEAAKSGSLAMIRWLAREAGVSTAGRVLLKLSHLCEMWPGRTPAHNRDLLEAVQLAVGAAGRRDQDAGGGGDLAGADADSDADSDSLDWDEGADSDDALDENLGGHGELSGSLLYKAVGRGDLALVQYLLQQQQLVPQAHQGRVVEVAARAGCEELLAWLVGQQACPLESRGGPYVVAAENGDVGTLAALRRLGVPWGQEDGLAKAVRRGCVEQALRWLVEQGLPVGGAKEVEGAVEFAVKRKGLGAEAAAWVRGLALARASQAGVGGGCGRGGRGLWEWLRWAWRV